MLNIRILIVDDHEMVREGLSAVLASESGMEVVGEAANGEEAVELAEKIEPDLIIMDLSMPHLNGLGAVRKILRSVPRTKILVLSSYRDRECVQKLLEAGATGYLTKQSAAACLCQAVREVYLGRHFYSPDVAKILSDVERCKHLPRMGELTAREVQVLKLVAQGFENKRIATELGISVKTVEKHRQAAMNKLNIHEAAGLTRYALSKGMLDENNLARN